MLKKRLLGCALLLASMAANADSTVTTLGEVNNFAADAKLALPVPDTSGVPYNVNVSYLKGNAKDLNGKNVVLVHGFAHDGDGLRLIADSFLANEANSIYGIYSIDLPGHGPSQWPKDTLLGDVSLTEYLTALETLLKTLPGGNDSDGTKADSTVLVGHSMGGIVIQMLAEKLASENLSLGARGVGSVMLIAPTPPEEVKWAGGFNPKMYTTMMASLTVGPENGCLAQMVNNGNQTLANDFTKAFFTDRQTKTLYAGTGDLPTADEVDYLNNAQPCQAGFEMLGLDAATGFKRPSVRAGVLAGTKTLALGFNGDMYVLPADVKNIYNYLTGRSSGCDGNLADAEAACALLSGPHDGIWTAPTEDEAPLLPYLHWALDYDPTP